VPPPPESEVLWAAVWGVVRLEEPGHDIEFEKAEQCFR